MNTFLNIFLTIFIQQFKLLIRNSEKPICDCAFCTFMYHLRKIWTWKIKMMRLVYHWIWYSNHCGQFHLFLRWDKIKNSLNKKQMNNSVIKWRGLIERSPILLLLIPHHLQRSKLRIYPKCFTFTRLICVKDGTLFSNN